MPDQYIVVLKDEDFLSSTRSSADKAINQGAGLRHIYNRALRGFAVTVLNDKVLDAIVNIPEVNFIQPDVKLNAFVQSLPTGTEKSAMYIVQ